MTEAEEATRTLVFDIAAAVTEFAKLTGQSPTVLYVGHREWTVLRTIYGLHPTAYSNLQVVQVRSHMSYLKVGI